MNAEKSFVQLWREYRDKPAWRAKCVLELEELLKQLEINKQNLIADTNAGCGFPTLDLRKRAWSVDAYDGSIKMVSEFKKEAILRQTSPEITVCPWNKYNSLPQQQYQTLLCLGNSFHYAPGGWFECLCENTPVFEPYHLVLEHFRNMLIDKGKVLIDKFPDDEKDKTETVAFREFKGKLFVRYSQDRKFRESGFKTTQINHAFKGYALQFPELKNMMHTVGFDTQCITLPSWQFPMIVGTKK